MKHLLYFTVVLLAILLPASCSKPQYFHESGVVFHTLYNIKYEAPKLLTDKIDAELQSFSLSLNPFNPNSIVAKVNRNEDVELDKWFTTVFNKAMEVSAISNGAFDVTVAPLVNLWGFGFENSDSISQHAIDSIKQFVGFRKVRIKNNRIVKDDPRIKFNFSAIAKGYACDVIAALLEREGVKNYMVDIGGEVTAKGMNANGNCWQIGINKVEDDSTGMVNEIERLVRLCEKSGLATSGNYRNYYIKDGKKYAHTIDPHTGYPTEKSILSASIICDNCMAADAFATVAMVKGVEEASKLAETIPEIQHYFFIYSDDSSPTGYKIKHSAGMESILVNYSK